MVVTIWFSDPKDFNLFCRMEKLESSEIIQTFHDGGRILAILDRPPSVASLWDEKKAKVLRQIREEDQ